MLSKNNEILKGKEMVVATSQYTVYLDREKEKFLVYNGYDVEEIDIVTIGDIAFD